MSEQQDNELICQKLLGWKLAGRSRYEIKMWLDTPYGDDGAQWHVLPTPTFTTWADAGLMLEALQASMHRPDLLAELADKLCEGNLTPAAIRAATLEYVRRLP